VLSRHGPVNGRGTAGNAGERQYAFPQVRGHIDHIGAGPGSARHGLIIRRSVVRVHPAPLFMQVRGHFRSAV
jgi:hypothetical protein